jgi:hypothetical protein
MPPVIRAVVAFAVGCACLFPGTAAALPGDPPIVAQAPADGAMLPTDPDGVPVSFTCPLYRSYDAGGGSSSPALGPDGRLADPVALDQASETPPTASGQCTAAMNAGGAQRPQETPGTYYWQAWRICTGCPLGYETGPVRKLVLSSGAKAALRPPARAWAGYPLALAISLPGVTNGAPVRIERKAGSGWQRLASTTAVGEAAEAVVTLARGTHRLRAVATLGAQTVTSPARRLTVRRAAHWTTTGKDDGAYTGRKPTVRFKVVKRGRLITGFSASVAMLCPSVQPGQFTTLIGTALVRRIRIAPDGSFLAASTPKRDTAVLVRGRLRHGQVGQARVKLSVGECSGDTSFRAKR